MTEVAHVPVWRRAEPVGADRRALGDTQAVIGFEVLKQPCQVSYNARAGFLDCGLEFRDRVGSVQEPEEFPHGRSGGAVETERKDLLRRGIEATEPYIGHRRRFPRVQGVFPLERAVLPPPAPDV